jgi:uncharacterized protein involved in response to NO
VHIVDQSALTHRPSMKRRRRVFIGHGFRPFFPFAALYAPIRTDGRPG